MKKFLIATALGLMLCSLLTAQNIRIELPPGYNKIMLKDEYTPGREGSPYLIEGWKPGTLTLWSGQVIQGLSYRYDILNNEMQYLVNNETWIIGSPDSIRELKFADRYFIYHDFTKYIDGEKGYYEVLAAGKLVLLAKHSIEIIHANYNAAMSTGSKNDKLIKKESYYILSDGRITPIDRKGKVFGDKQNEIADYVKKMDLSFKKKDDLIKIVNYYNSLN